MLYKCVTKLFKKYIYFYIFSYRFVLDIPQALPAKYADSIDLKGGLLNYRVVQWGS